MKKPKKAQRETYFERHKCLLRVSREHPNKDLARGRVESLKYIVSIKKDTRKRLRRTIVMKWVDICLEQSDYLLQL